MYAYLPLLLFTAVPLISAAAIYKESVRLLKTAAVIGTIAILSFFLCITCMRISVSKELMEAVQKETTQKEILPKTEEPDSINGLIKQGYNIIPEGTDITKEYLRGSGFITDHINQTIIVYKSKGHK